MESKIRDAPPGMGRLWDFACALPTSNFTRIFKEAKLTRRFRRIVTQIYGSYCNMQYSWHSVFPFSYIIRPVYRIAWHDSPPCFGPSLFTDAANAAVLPCNGGLLRFSARRFEQIEINRECKDTDRNSPCRLKEWTICSASCSFVHSCRYRQIGRSLFVVFVSVTLQMYKKL